MSDFIDTLQDRSPLMSRCVRCSHCKFVATPKSHAFASACPSIDWGQFHSYSASGQMIAGQALLEGRAQASQELLRTVYSCTMCGACDTSCKVNLGEMIEPLESLYALRAHLVSTGHSPQSHKTLVGNLVAHGNRLGRPRGDRARWAEGLGLPDATSRSGVLLHIGDDLSYDEARWIALRSIVRTIEAAGVSLAYAGTNEGSCGGLAYDLGYVDDAKALAAATRRTLQQSGAGTLVTFSAAAYAAFRALYPRFGIALDGVRILHISEYLEELCVAARIGIEAMHSGRATYHDPCKLGRLSEPWQPHDRGIDVELGYYVSRDRTALRFGNGGCYNAPRALIRRLGFDLVELERSEASSYCCGAGGGVAEENPDAADTAGRSRLAEIASAEAGVCVTACGGCKSHLEKTAGRQGQGLAFADLLELVAQAIRPGPVP